MAIYHAFNYLKELNETMTLKPCIHDRLFRVREIPGGCLCEYVLCLQGLPFLSPDHFFIPKMPLVSKIGSSLVSARISVDILSLIHNSSLSVSLPKQGRRQSEATDEYVHEEGSLHREKVR